MKSVIVTGGAGFIGSHLVKSIKEKYPNCVVHVVDSITYAGNEKNLEDVEHELHKIDIRFSKDLSPLENLKIDGIFHLAAESHVDRSIENPHIFLETNVMGTVNMLDLGMKYFSDNPNFLFYHISTDEVFGSLDFNKAKFSEETPYDPKSPYSASKASSDHFVRAYNHTYGLPIVISNCSNNYGTHQYPEKMIPVIINSIKNNKSIPVYGTGENVRDWLHVKDHTEAIIEIFENGIIGETYCIGGDCELNNLQLVFSICDLCDEYLGREIKESRKLISFVTDRKGHDLRYAINTEKIKNDLGWKPKRTIEEGLKETIQWYMDPNNLNE